MSAGKVDVLGATEGEVRVTVSGYTASGKSAVCGEIEILCRALGLQVHWIQGQAERHLTHGDWQSALELYKPRVLINEINVSRSPVPSRVALVAAAQAVRYVLDTDTPENDDRPLAERIAAAALECAPDLSEWKARAIHLDELLGLAVESLRRCACESDGAQISALVERVDAALARIGGDA